jgi:hypothetical protein
MNIRVLGNRPAMASVRDLVARLRREAAPVIRVERQQIPYWRQQGWTRSGNRYTGSYQTPNGAFGGLADRHSPSYYRFYIFDPPEELARHSHWVCFVPRGGSTYEVHLARQPADVSSGILTIERLLVEAFQHA